MRTFAHLNAESLDQVYVLFETHADRVRLNAGGTDLLGCLKDDLWPTPPEVLVNLKGIPGMAEIFEEDDGLAIGALTTLSRIASSALIRTRYPALAEAARSVGTPQLRNVGTLGGNLCQEVRCWYFRYPASLGGPKPCPRKGSGPCLALKGDNRYHAVTGGRGCYAVCPSDTAVALAALDGQICIGSRNGVREVPVCDFYTPMGTVLQPGELVTRIRIPAVKADAAQRFVKFAARKALDFAVVSIATLVTLEEGVCRDVRLALGAVAPGPVRATESETWLIGKPLNEETAAVAAKSALAGAKPLSKNAYKIKICETLARRSLLGRSA